MRVEPFTDRVDRMEKAASLMHWRAGTPAGDVHANAQAFVMKILRTADALPEGAPPPSEPVTPDKRLAWAVRFGGDDQFDAALKERCDG